MSDALLPKRPKTNVKVGAPGPLSSPPAARDRTGAELLTPIIRNLHGYSFLRVEVLRAAWLPQHLHQRSKEKAVWYGGTEVPGDGKGAETTSRST